MRKLTFIGLIALVLFFIPFMGCDSTKQEDVQGNSVPEPTVKIEVPQVVTVGEEFTFKIIAPAGNRERYKANMNHGYSNNVLPIYSDDPVITYTYKEIGGYMVMAYAFNDKGVAKQVSKRITVQAKLK